MEKRPIIHRWMIMVLTFLAGYVNVEGIIECGVTVSHYTGNLSNLGKGLVLGDIRRVQILVSILLLFFTGSLLIGMVNQREFRTPRNRYKWILVVQGVLLIVVYHRFENILPYLLAFYMGIQNGAFAMYKGIRVRFTHMTGYLTEAALELAAILRRKASPERFLFYLFSMSSFVFGGVVAAIIEVYNHNILIPISSILYIIVAYGLHRTTRIGYDHEN